MITYRRITKDAAQKVSDIIGPSSAMGRALKQLEVNFPDGGGAIYQGPGSVIVHADVGSVAEVDNKRLTEKTDV